MMQIQAAGLSDCGRFREHNDDHYCIGPITEQESLTALSIDTSSSLFQRFGFLAAVADGIGGYAGGSVASRLALETLSAIFYGEEHIGCTGEELVACMMRYCQQTNAVVSRVLSRTPEYADAGTTIAGIALLPSDILVVFHAGDSRVLRAAAGYARPLTIDHTPIGQDVASGRITEEEAASLPASSQLTRALGRIGDTRVEIQSPQTWAAGDQFLISTDGLHGIGRGLTRKTIQEAIRVGGTPEYLVRKLITDAIQSDGQDNATLILVSLTDNEADHDR